MVDAPGSHTARRLAQRFRIENLYNHFRPSRSTAEIAHGIISFE
jgi:hypothetical protein